MSGHRIVIHPGLILYPVRRISHDYYNTSMIAFGVGDKGDVQYTDRSNRRRGHRDRNRQRKNAKEVHDRGSSSSINKTSLPEQTGHTASCPGQVPASINDCSHASKKTTYGRGWWSSNGLRVSVVASGQKHQNTSSSGVGGTATG